MRGTNMPLTALCSLDMNVSYYAAGQHSNPKNPGLFFQDGQDDIMRFLMLLCVLCEMEVQLHWS